MSAIIKRLTAIALLVAITIVLLILSRGTYAAHGEADGRSVVHSPEPAMADAD
jgi:hypothetical protein